LSLIQKHLENCASFVSRKRDHLSGNNPPHLQVVLSLSNLLLLRQTIQQMLMKGMLVNIRQILLNGVDSCMYTTLHSSDVRKRGREIDRKGYDLTVYKQYINNIFSSANNLPNLFQKMGRKTRKVGYKIQHSLSHVLIIFIITCDVVLILDNWPWIGSFK